MFNGINRFIEKRDIVTFRINVKTLKNIISVADGFERKKLGYFDTTIKDKLFFLSNSFVCKIQPWVVDYYWRKKDVYFALVLS